MNKIKDFLYSISDLLMAFIVILIILFVFYKNISVFFTDIFTKDLILSKNIKNIAKNIQDFNKPNDIDKKDDIKKDTITDTAIKYDTQTNKKNIQNSANNTNDSSNIPQENNNQNIVNITINIPVSSSSTDIVDILYSNGIISSKEDMSKYLKENNLETTLKSGTFTLNSSMTLEEIAKTISI